MDMMAIRRRVIMGSLKSGLGEYTKGYYAVLTPSSTTEFVIPHNLGIIPKVCIVEANFEPIKGIKSGLNGVYVFRPLALTDTAILCAKIYTYWYQDRMTNYRDALTNINFVTESEIRLSPLYSSAKSPWNTSGTYTVRVMG